MAVFPNPLLGNILTLHPSKAETLPRGPLVAFGLCPPRGSSLRLATLEDDQQGAFRCFVFGEEARRPRLRRFCSSLPRTVGRRKAERSDAWKAGNTTKALLKHVQGRLRPEGKQAQDFAQRAKQKGFAPGVPSLLTSTFQFPLLNENVN